MTDVAGPDVAVARPAEPAEHQAALLLREQQEQSESVARLWNCLTWRTVDVPVGRMPSHLVLSGDSRHPQRALLLALLLGMRLTGISNRNSDSKCREQVVVKLHGQLGQRVTGYLLHP